MQYRIDRAGEAPFFGVNVRPADAKHSYPPILAVFTGVNEFSPSHYVPISAAHARQRKWLEFIRAGANGFLVKEATVEDFIGTIRAVAEGTTVVPQALAEALLSHIASEPNGTNSQDTNGVDRMTLRETEISRLIGVGMSNRQIAERLDITVFTVKTHVHNILEKLALHSRLQIAAYLHHKDSFQPVESQTTLI